MEVYWVKENDLNRVPEKELENEAALENHLIKTRGAEIGSVKLLYIGRQGSPDRGGIFDILAVDREGNTVVVELKRGRAPRDVVAQALEYASGIRKERYDTLNERFHEFLHEHGSDEEYIDELPDLAAAHAEFFGLEDSLSKREFNADQRLIVVGTEFRDVSINMADFLREHGVDVICVEYNAYETDDGEIELLTTDDIRRPLSQEPSSDSSRSGPDYSDFNREIKRKVFPKIREMLNAESPDDIFGGDVSKRTLIRSNHPSHPFDVAYFADPRPSDDGTVKVNVTVDGGTDETKARIQSIVDNAAPELRAEGFKVRPEKLLAIIQKKMEYEIDPSDVNEEVVDEMTDAYVEMIRLVHPKLADGM